MRVSPLVLIGLLALLPRAEALACPVHNEHEEWLPDVAEQLGKGVPAIRVRPEYEQRRTAPFGRITDDSLPLVPAGAELDILATVPNPEWKDWKQPGVELVDLTAGRNLELNLRPGAMARENRGWSWVLLLHPLESLVAGHDYAVKLTARSEPEPGYFRVTHAGTTPEPAHTDGGRTRGAWRWFIATVLGAAMICLARRRRRPFAV